MTGKTMFLPLPLWPCTNVGLAASVPPCGLVGIHVPKSPSTPPECGQTFLAGLRYNHETSAATFSPRKSVSSYDPVPVNPSLRPLSRQSPDTKSPPMRPDFRSCLRYNRAANETSFSYKTLNDSYDFGRISYERAASRSISSATESPPNETKLS